MAYQRNDYYVSSTSSGKIDIRSDGNGTIHLIRASDGAELGPVFQGGAPGGSAYAANLTAAQNRAQAMENASELSLAPLSPAAFVNASARKHSAIRAVSPVPTEETSLKISAALV